MNSFISYGRRIGIAAAGIGVLGAGMATAAFAAPGALPSPSDVPVPVLTRPVDASNGLLGISRGSIPGVATPNLQQVPVLNQLPDMEVVPLPQDDAPSASVAPSTPAPAETATEPTPATDTVTPERTSGGSALAGLDDAGFTSGLARTIPAG